MRLKLISIISFFYLVSLSNYNYIYSDQNDSRLEILFKKLKNSKRNDATSILENKIWQIWLEHDNLDIKKLMKLGITAMGKKKYQDALNYFENITKIDPNFAEGWNKKATVLYLMHRYNDSEINIGKTLSLEPRHFGAWAGLSLICFSREDWEGAIKSLTKGLEVHPKMKGLKDHLKYAKQKFKESLI